MRTAGYGLVFLCGAAAGAMVSVGICYRVVLSDLDSREVHRVVRARLGLPEDHHCLPEHALGSRPRFLCLPEPRRELAAGVVIGPGDVDWFEWPSDCVIQEVERDIMGRTAGTRLLVGEYVRSERLE